MPVMDTSRNGTRPTRWSVIMIIRATQKKMMSKPVTSTLVGSATSKTRSPIASSSGQPWVLNGNIADENQVSSRSEEHTSELQSIMRITYTIFCFKKHNLHTTTIQLYGLYKT